MLMSASLPLFPSELFRKTSSLPILRAKRMFQEGDGWRSWENCKWVRGEGVEGWGYVDHSYEKWWESLEASFFCVSNFFKKEKESTPWCWVNMNIQCSHLCTIMVPYLPDWTFCKCLLVSWVYDCTCKSYVNHISFLLELSCWRRVTLSYAPL